MRVCQFRHARLQGLIYLRAQALSRRIFGNPLIRTTLHISHTVHDERHVPATPARKPPEHPGAPHSPRSSRAFAVQASAPSSSERAA